MPGNAKEGKISKTVTLDKELVARFEKEMFNNCGGKRLSAGLDIVMAEWLARRGQDPAPTDPSPAPRENDPAKAAYFEEINAILKRAMEALEHAREEWPESERPKQGSKRRSA